MTGQGQGGCAAVPRLDDVESTRRYDQPCPLATALDVLGSRWTLLIVRELLLGSKRFGELQKLLPGIGPNRLSARLKELQEQHVVGHDDQHYGLTPYGEGLRQPLIGMSIWGLNLMGDTLDLATVRADMVALCLAGSVRRSDLGDLETCCEVRLDDEVITLAAARGTVSARNGAADRPDAILTCSTRTFVDLATGAVALPAALDGGRAEVSGERAGAERLLSVLAGTASDLLAGTA